MVKEAQEILDALELESKEEGSWGDLFKNGGISANKRFYLALGIQFMQQLTGRHPPGVFHFNSLTRVSTRYQHRDVLRANTLRVESAHVARNGALPRLLATSLVYYRVFRHSKHFHSGCYPPLADHKCQWYTIDRVGRRNLWITFAIGQMIVLVLEAICVALDNSRASIAAVFFVFLYESFFTWGKSMSAIPDISTEVIILFRMDGYRVGISR